MNATRLFTIAFALAVLAGCGNKGPLVLPTPPIDPATVPEVPAEAAPEEAAPEETTPAETPAVEPAEDGSTPPPAEVPAETPATTDGDGNG